MASVIVTAIFCGGCRGANRRPPRRLGKSTHHPPPRKVESHRRSRACSRFVLGVVRVGPDLTESLSVASLSWPCLTSGRPPAQRHLRACPALPTLARAPVVPLSVPTPALTSPPLSLCPIAPSAPAARAARSRPLLAPSARAACSRRSLAPHSLPARASLARRSHLALFASRPRRVPRSRLTLFTSRSVVSVSRV